MNAACVVKKEDIRRVIAVASGVTGWLTAGVGGAVNRREAAAGRAEVRRLALVPATHWTSPSYA